MAGSVGVAAHPQMMVVHKQIGGKLYKLHLHANRFEQHMDKIDQAVNKGAKYADLLTRFSEFFVDGNKDITPPAAKADDAAPASTPAAKPTASAAPAGGPSKQEIVANAIREFPHMSAGQIAKKVSAHGAMTYANAYFYAGKLKKASA